MDLHKLPKLGDATKRRLARGHGSGRGKTAGRGTKGQKARERIRLGFEGGQIRLIKRLPLLRGMGRNSPNKRKPLVVNIKHLNRFPPNTEVTVETLVHFHVIRRDLEKSISVKILGDGELSVPLTVKLPTSLRAKKKIEAAGGSVVIKTITDEAVVQSKLRSKKQHKTKTA